ncbi:MAG: RpiB/LacA/LacB family sugar-phosphate isomerase [Candidatus Humimicrobiaceae bacterium]
MKIAIGCDPNAVERMEDLIEILEEKNIEYQKFPIKDDYPDVAKDVTEAVQKGSFDRGILVCGTGIGMAICANKFKGIRAAVCHDLYSAQRSILSNDCQVLTMGAFIIGRSLAQEILKVWLDIERTGGTVKKVKKIEELEK